MTANTIFLATINFYGVGSAQPSRLPDFNNDFNNDFLIAEEQAEDNDE